MEFLSWGEIPYEVCEERQLEILEEISRGQRKDTVVFCSHPPVVTLGRSTKDGDLQGWAGATYHVRRGGRATYHGPDQLVAYFLFDLDKPIFSQQKKDVVGLLRFIEASAIQLLQSYGLSARGKTLDGDGSDLNDTGVWIENRKIASVGIAVKKWISYHGIALNVDYSSQAFQGIQPCGFQTSVMTNLEKELNQKLSREELIQRWESVLLSGNRPIKKKK